MKDKAIFRKWWFWAVAVVVVIGVAGAFDNGSDTNSNSADQSQVVEEAKLPILDVEAYRGKEGLLVYKELKSKGYTIDAEFNKPALTDINGKASSLFESLDPDKADDRQSVDSFVVSSLAQTGDSVMLTVALESN